MSRADLECKVNDILSLSMEYSGVDIMKEISMATIETLRDFLANIEE